jgi:hypothetical protein
MALPMMTDSVKSTNCTGMTCVESKCCRARLRYLICKTAVDTRTATKRYVIGKVTTCQMVFESNEATPLVERAV